MKTGIGLALGLSAAMLAGTVCHAAPKPLIEFLFESMEGGKVRNTGSTETMYPLADVTAVAPVWTTIAAPTGGKGALDFGTTVDEYAVDLNGPVDDMAGLESFTITGWLNCRSRQEGMGGNRIVSWIKDGGEGVDLVYRTDGSLQLSVNQWPDSSPAKSSGKRVTTDANAAAANWVYFAVTYDSTPDTGNVRFYFGGPDKPATPDKAIKYKRDAVGSDIGPEFTIGHFNTATRGKATDRMFRGIIDDIRVFGKALTPEEVEEVRKPH